MRLERREKYNIKNFITNVVFYFILRKYICWDNFWRWFWIYKFHICRTIPLSVLTLTNNYLVLLCVFRWEIRKCLVGVKFRGSCYNDNFEVSSEHLCIPVSGTFWKHRKGVLNTLMSFSAVIDKFACNIANCLLPTLAVKSSSGLCFVG